MKSKLVCLGLLVSLAGCASGAPHARNESRRAGSCAIVVQPNPGSSSTDSVTRDALTSALADAYGCELIDGAASFDYDAFATMVETVSADDAEERALAAAQFYAMYELHPEESVVAIAQEHVVQHLERMLDEGRIDTLPDWAMTLDTRESVRAFLDQVRTALGTDEDARTHFRALLDRAELVTAQILRDQVSELAAERAMSSIFLWTSEEHVDSLAPLGTALDEADALAPVARMTRRLTIEVGHRTVDLLVAAQNTATPTSRVVMLRHALGDALGYDVDVGSPVFRLELRDRLPDPSDSLRYQPCSIGGATPGTDACVVPWGVERKTTPLELAVDEACLDAQSLGADALWLRSPIEIDGQPPIEIVYCGVFHHGSTPSF